MISTYSEEQLSQLFRTQLPSMPIPAEFRLALQQRMLAEAVAGLKPKMARIAATPLRGRWFSRLLRMFRKR